MGMKAIGWIVVPCLAVVAAGGAAVVLGVHVPQRAGLADLSAPKAERATKDQQSALDKAQDDVRSVASALAAISPAPGNDKSGPSFDVARVEQSGDAVIAGRAAPGAAVELLGNGKVLDRARADTTGHFVMTPSRLPEGNYDLTLKASRPDGSELRSERGVPVTIAAAKAADPSTTSSFRLAAAGRGDTLAGRPGATGSGAPPDKLARRDDVTGTANPERRPGGTTVVSRGDSLWQISKASYGDGLHYPAIVRANRDKIRDPNLIFPGQTFQLPKPER